MPMTSHLHMFMYDKMIETNTYFTFLLKVILYGQFYEIVFVKK